MIAAAAVQEAVDAVGLSIMSGAHMTLFPAVIDALKARGVGDVVVFGGGIVPEGRPAEARARSASRRSSRRARARTRSSTGSSRYLRPEGRRDASRAAALVRRVAARRGVSGAAPEPLRPERRVGGRRPSRSRRRRSTPPRPSQEERLAAIQKAMNELDEAAQGCWAAAAVERFDIEGELTARIDIGGRRARSVDARRATPRATRKLARCVDRGCSTRYRVGAAAARPDDPAAVPVPRARRPERDRSRAGRRGTGRARSRSRCCSTRTTPATPRRSMFELAIAAGGTTGMRDRRARRALVLPRPGDGRRHMRRQAGRAIAAGDMMFVPRGRRARGDARPRATSTRWS